MKKPKLITGSELVRRRWAKAGEKERHEVGLKLAAARAAAKARRESGLSEQEFKRLGGESGIKEALMDAAPDISIRQFHEAVQSVLTGKISLAKQLAAWAKLTKKGKAS